MNHSLRTSIVCLVLATAGIAAPSALANSGALSVFTTSGGTRWATTGTPASTDTLQTILGFVEPTSSPTTSPLYECLNNGLDRFLVLNTCGGYAQIDLEGNIFSTVPSDQATVPLYRCSIVGGYHFASTAADCGGDHVDGPLGAIAESAPLDYYVEGSGGPTWVTTGSAPAGFALASTLGYLVGSSEPNTIPLLQCLNSSNDHFLSIDACEGQPEIGVEGALFSTPPSGTASVPVYRCSYPGSYHFASNSASCSGQHTDGLLGYALQQPLPPPAQQPTPVPTPITASAPATRRGSKKALHVHVTLSWTWSYGRTRLRAIKVRRPPKGTRLTLKCRGRGCPRRPLTGTATTLVRRPVTYRSGERLTLLIVAPGRSPLTIRIRIRFGAVPALIASH